MARFDLRQFAHAALSAYSGQQAGKLAAQQQAQADQDAADQQALAWFTHSAQLEDQQRQQRLEPYRLAAGIQGQTPESQAAAVNAYLQQSQSQQAEPRQYGPEQFQQLYRGTRAGRRGPQMQPFAAGSPRPGAGQGPPPVTL